MSPDWENNLEIEIQVTHWSLYFLVDLNDKIDLKGILGQVYCPIVHIAMVPTSYFITLVSPLHYNTMGISRPSCYSCLMSQD